MMSGSQQDPSGVSDRMNNIRTPQGGDPIKTGNWSNGLFGCFNNVALCGLTFLAPCITFGRMAEALGDDCVCYGLLYMIPILNCYLESQYRETIRERRAIMESRLVDFFSIFMCPPCALTQESMEIREIQAEELRLGAIAGGAPSPAVVTSPPTGHEVYYQPNHHGPGGVPNPGVASEEPYYPPSLGTWENTMEMNRQ